MKLAKAHAPRDPVMVTKTQPNARPMTADQLPGGARPRVLVMAFGSAGDVFPLVPIVQNLEGQGCQVRFATRRSTGLYLRAAGVPTIALGDGSELAGTRDESAVSPRRGGWRGWRRTAEAYVASSLDEDVQNLMSVVAEWRPDVIVAGSFATAARVVGTIAGVPTIDVSIYPQHEALSGSSGGHFATALRDEVKRVLHKYSCRIDDPGRQIWGSPTHVLLHDEALLGRVPSEPPPIGFPSWDEVRRSREDEERAGEWLSSSRTVVVTLGSFLGLVQEKFWVAVARSLTRTGVRALVIGAPSDIASAMQSDRIRTSAFLPLSSILHRSAGAVHHGGIGTTFACLRAGIPSIVVPQSYDQFFNGRLVESCGAGITAGEETLSQALVELSHGAFEESARAIQERLVPSDVAAQTAANAIISGIGSQQ